MEKTSALSLALLLLFVAGAEASACKDVPATPIAAACRQASTSDHLYDLCVGMLEGSPDSGDVRSYALAAVDAVLKSYEAAIDQTPPSASADMKKALFSCTQDYFTARLNFENCKTVLESNSDCELQSLEEMYMDAIVDVDGCATKILPNRGESPSTYDMVITDRHRSFLAFGLGLLVANP